MHKQCLLPAIMTKDLTTTSTMVFSQKKTKLLFALRTGRDFIIPHPSFCDEAATTDTSTLAAATTTIVAAIVVVAVATTTATTSTTTTTTTRHFACHKSLEPNKFDGKEKWLAQHLEFIHVDSTI
jgi:hypothetical protein